MGPSLTGIVAGFVVLGVLLWPLERKWPGVAGQRLRRRGFATDVAYWFFTPFVTRGITRLAVIGAVVALALLLGVPMDAEHVRAFFEDPSRAVRRQPVALQGGRCCSSASRRRSWPATCPSSSFWAIFLHANVPWSFGPFRYAIASPAFHRWHHTSEEEGRDKNFAGLFPFLDLLFGTFYLPEDRQPRRFGLAHEEVPEGLVAQLLYPFRRAAA